MRKLANGTNHAKRFLRSLREDIDFFGFSDIGKKEENLFNGRPGRRNQSTRGNFPSPLRARFTSPINFKNHDLLLCKRMAA